AGDQFPCQYKQCQGDSPKIRFEPRASLKEVAGSKITKGETWSLKQHRSVAFAENWLSQGCTAQKIASSWYATF
ncbi:hypothetical protein, partial [Candidatus Magnetobacterium casense]|uniref:hypothetical protein n=1 Tax=Candidatus Magnetobacterium casense TaxID=1455061 RepID=UPI001C439BD8